jgi:hypothetical protein
MLLPLFHHALCSYNLQRSPGPIIILILKLAIHGPMIYTAPYVMLLMGATTKQVGRGGALEIKTFLGLVKGHQAVRRVPFGAKKVETSRAQPPLTWPSNGFARIKSITYRAVSIRGPLVILCTFVSVFLFCVLTLLKLK